MTQSPGERRDHARRAAQSRWATVRPTERKDAMQPAVRGLEARFIKQVDPEGVLTPEELAICVENARQAHMAKMRMARAKRARERRERAA